VIISSVTDLVDFLGAWAFGKACAELSDNERNSKTLSIFSSLTNPLLVPLAANASMFDLRLSREALFAAQLTAIGVIVKNMH